MALAEANRPATTTMEECSESILARNWGNYMSPHPASFYTGIWRLNAQTDVPMESNEPRHCCLFEKRGLKLLVRL